MNFDDATPFFQAHHRGVIATRRPNGATHSSIVVCGAYEGKAAFVSVYPRSQKIVNLRRDPELHRAGCDGRLATVGIGRGQSDAAGLRKHPAGADARSAARGVYGVQPHGTPGLGRVRPGDDRPGGGHRTGSAGAGVRAGAELDSELVSQPCDLGFGVPGAGFGVLGAGFGFAFRSLYLFGGAEVFARRRGRRGADPSFPQCSSSPSTSLKPRTEPSVNVVSAISSYAPSTKRRPFMGKP